MKERQILFSGPMVRAILKNRKGATRRVVKGGQIPTENPAEEGRHRWSAIAQKHPRYGFCVFGETEEECARELAEFAPCPYGKPGDRLWVRETIYAWGRWETRFSAKKGRDEWHFIDMTLECGKQYRYPASMMGANAPRPRSETSPMWWKRPAIHGPRVASRILLEITDVRVERLNDITWEQAVAEGISMDGEGLFHVEEGRHLAADPRDSFQGLWESINGDGSWASNPWVWAVSFKRVEVANADQ